MKRPESSFLAGYATQNFSHELKEIAKRQPLQVERGGSLFKTSSIFGSVPKNQSLRKCQIILAGYHPRIWCSQVPIS